MKIRYNEFVANPALRNTETNLPAHVAQVLIAQGVAVYVPYKDFRERLAAEHASASGPGNVAVPVVSGVEWSVVAHLPVSGRPCIMRKSGTEVQHFEALTFWHPYGDPSGKEYPIPQLKDCPASIKKQFSDFVCPGGGRNYERIEREQQESDAATKTQTNRFFRALGLRTEGAE